MTFLLATTYFKCFGNVFNIFILVQYNYSLFNYYLIIIIDFYDNRKNIYKFKMWYLSWVSGERANGICSRNLEKSRWANVLIFHVWKYYVLNNYKTFLRKYQYHVFFKKI